MKVWKPYIGTALAEFLTERGVDMPRAWSLHCRRESSKGIHDARFRTFKAFLIAEHPVEMAKWRILGGK